MAFTLDDTKSYDSSLIRRYYEQELLRRNKPCGHPDFYTMTEDEVKLHSEKNRDYAQGGDPLGNFYRVANILSNYPDLKPDDPVVVALVYALKQLDAALWLLHQGYEGKVENVDTRLRDVHVYIKLARILHKELTENNCSALASGA